MRKIIPGVADGSYGVEVAKLAGMPAKVVKRARDILAELEEKGPSRIIVPVQAPLGMELPLGQTAMGVSLLCRVRELFWVAIGMLLIKVGNKSSCKHV